MNLEFDPGRQPSGDGQSRQPDGLVGVARAARVGQKEVAFRIDEIENVGERIAPTGKIGAPQRDRDELSPARFERVAHQFVGGKFAGANKQARCKFAIGDFEFRPFIGHLVNL
jgi:hypothetical protein